MFGEAPVHWTGKRPQQHDQADEKARINATIQDERL
jgi:hypothetical protein